jgi:S1-C subfamily serine protease
MGLLRRASVVWLGLACAALGARADDALSPDALQRLKDATVYIKTEIGPIGMTGSGFVIDVTGDAALIATNHHVIAKPKVLEVGSFIPGLRGRDQMALRKLQLEFAKTEPKVAVVFNSGNGNEQTIKADVVGGLEEPDLAILRVEGIKSPPKPIAFRYSPKPVETMSLYMLGFPFGDMLATNKGNPTITIGKGSVSSIRNDNAGKISKVQIDGALNPGNSGGPVVDLKGNLIGIAVQTIQGSNIGLAIPPGELVNIMEGRVGVPTVVAQPEKIGNGLRYEVAIPVIDPLKKLKSVSVQFVEGAVPIDPAKSGQPQLQPAAANHTVNLKIADGVARGALPLGATSEKKARDLTVQASYVNILGKTVHLDPLVLKVAVPIEVTTTAEQSGNTTTITQTAKTPQGGTIRREVTVTRGSGSGPSKMSKAKPGKTEIIDPDDDDDADDADEKPKSKKKIVGKSTDSKGSGKPAEVGWTNKISKMKNIPDEEVTGQIDGVEFTLDKATLNMTVLTLKKNPSFRGIFAEAELKIMLFTKPNEDVSGRRFVVNGRVQPGSPSIFASSMRKGDKLPNSQPHLDYCMILEFGDYDAKLRMQPGKIYICLPDRARSFLAGSFEAGVE